ncbi:flagellar basal body rod protein FlgB [Hahella sp. SMD15-11]|uniref:Flagellar basal body rod protein FlgB n=1 Tax=Thermohahella caldifontis TaxID=3142973 RepID=A0AB39UY83_9GAMM
MALSFDKALGIHQKALEVRVQRAEVLADNLANADTPGYKARDLDFRAILAGEAARGNRLPLERTHEGHIPDDSSAAEGDLLYRVPVQPSIDGNTVDTQIESAEFARNALDFQTSFQFLNSKFKGLVTAIKGE